MRSAGSSPSPAGSSSTQDPIHEQLLRNYYDALKRKEIREAEIDEARQKRKAEAILHNAHFAELKDTKQRKFVASIEAETLAKQGYILQLEAAKLSVTSHCVKLGIEYVPGKTCENDILRVAPKPRAQAAVEMDLRYGTGFKDPGGLGLKLLTSILCGFVSSIAMGGLVVGISLKHPLSNTIGAVFALVLGFTVSFCVWRFLDHLWGMVGTVEGFGRPDEVRNQILNSARNQTLIVLAGLMILDAIGLVTANAAKAALSPIYALPLWEAMILAGCVNTAYVSSMANAGRKIAYNNAAADRIDGYVDEDVRIKRDRLVNTGVQSPQVTPSQVNHVQGALESLSTINVKSKQIEDSEVRLKTGEESHLEDMRILASLQRDVSDAHSASELTELRHLENEVVRAKELLNSHTISKAVLGLSVTDGVDDVQ